MAFISRKEKGKVNQLARGLDVEFAAVDVPRADEIVEKPACAGGPPDWWSRKAASMHQMTCWSR